LRLLAKIHATQDRNRQGVHSGRKANPGVFLQMCEPESDSTEVQTLDALLPKNFLVVKIKRKYSYKTECSLQ
jgi:hypothetical protein